MSISGFARGARLASVAVMSLLLDGQAAAPKGGGVPAVLADIGPAPAVALIDQAGRPFALQDLRGKAVLVWQEQGLGDMLMFGRYIPMLKAYGAAWVTLACAPALHRLFSEVSELDAVVDANCALARAEHDFWTLPLSIPRYVGTALESIPPAVYLGPPKERIEKWRARLGPASRPRIGLVWKGNPAHANDSHRSLGSLTELEPLLGVPGVRFVSLQKGAGEDEARALQAKYALTHVGTEIEDFADSAAIISQLDLVICVDTAVAHLAGTLGKPCWVMLPQHDTDWRWLRERTDSPWYPRTVRRLESDDRGPQACVHRKIRRLNPREHDTKGRQDKRPLSRPRTEDETVVGR